MNRDWNTFVQRQDFEKLAPLAQGLFLEDAMTRLDLSRDDFASRISVSRSCLKKWLVDQKSEDFRRMPLMAWKFLSEILERESAR